MKPWLTKRHIADRATALTEASCNCRRFLLAALLALLIGLLATPHRVLAHSVADASAAADHVDVVTGTVVGVVIEDRVKNATFTYRELQLDDGTAVPLQGAAAESLPDGAYVRVTGNRVGTPLEVAGVETLAAAPPAQPATTAQE